MSTKAQELFLSKVGTPNSATFTGTDKTGFPNKLASIIEVDASITMNKIHFLINSAILPVLIISI